MKTKQNFIIPLILLITTVSWGKIIYVGDVRSGYISQIQAAINSSHDGDTVIITPGTYTGIGNRDIDFKGKAIIVRSTDPNNPQIVAGTKIDCQGNGRSFIFQTNERSNSILEGLTITNGKALNGSGILINQSSPTITKCTIRDCGQENPTCQFGGGICILSGSPLITDCTVKNNATYNEGAGIYSEYGSPAIKNCVIENNHSGYGQGGGIFHNRSGNPSFVNCTICYNYARNDGGGVGIDGDVDINDCKVLISDCLITGNTSDIKTGGGIYIQQNNALISHCIISHNYAIAGGGLYLGGRGATDRYTYRAEHCQITGNSGGSKAGGLYVTLSTLKMNNCIISGNSNIYGSAAGGLLIDIGTFVDINQCTITGNKVNQVEGQNCRGGGIYMRMCDLTITNSIIHQNYATQGAEIAINAWNGVQSPSIPPIEDPTIVTLHYNNFSDAKDHDFYIFGEPNRLTLNTYGNMNVDPLFAGNGYWDTNNTSNIINDDFWVDGDYHLKSKAGRWDPNTLNWVHDDVNSPCIDAGDPNSGLGGELWPHGKRINMGAYGGTAMASMSLSNIGDIRDLNNDNLITLDDVLLLADKWDSNDVPLKEDLDLNGIVDSNDLVFFEGNWPDDSNNIVPEFDFISDQYVDTGYELSFSVSAFDNDGDELVYMALGLPDGATFSEQLFSWIPEKPGTYTITFVASDSKSLDFMTLLIVVEENEL